MSSYLDLHLIHYTSYQIHNKQYIECIKTANQEYQNSVSRLSKLYILDIKTAYREYHNSISRVSKQHIKSIKTAYQSEILTPICFRSYDKKMKVSTHSNTTTKQLPQNARKSGLFGDICCI